MAAAFAFVELGTVDDASILLEKFNDKTLIENKVQIKFVESDPTTPKKAAMPSRPKAKEAEKRKLEPIRSNLLGKDKNDKDFFFNGVISSGSVARVFLEDG
jgi:hypothetical protein